MPGPLGATPMLKSGRTTESRPVGPPSTSSTRLDSPVRWPWASRPHLVGAPGSAWRRGGWKAWPTPDVGGRAGGFEAAASCMRLTSVLSPGKRHRRLLPLGQGLPSSAQKCQYGRPTWPHGSLSPLRMSVQGRGPEGRVP